MNDFETNMATGTNYWLGPIVQAHTIGDFQIIEYQQVDFSDAVKRKLTGNRMFGCYVGGESTRHSYDSLDRAILGCLEYKYDGLNSQFARFAAMMLRMDDEK